MAAPIYGPCCIQVCIFTLLSAVANQLLLQARLKRGYDSEDECVLCFFRCVMLSVSVPRSKNRADGASLLGESETTS